MKHGAMDYLQKPFTEDELTAFIDQSLLRRQDRIERRTKPQVHLVTPSSRADSSRHTINVPAGVFVSPAHCWISLEPSGTARVGLDDFALKLLGPIEQIELPTAGQRIRKGAPLFAARRGDQRISFPSPVTGRVASTNAELPGRLGFLQMKPFDLGWICTVEPDSLPGDLQSLILGAGALEWYQKDIDRYSAQVARLTSGAQHPASADEERQRGAAAAWQAFAQTFVPTGTEGVQ
jgi:glycine cleavage system H lipoate-binding protein